jgi:signal transduction histidine kinase/ActR/RegA family two-component response regulator
MKPKWLRGPLAPSDSGVKGGAWNAVMSDAWLFAAGAAVVAMALRFAMQPLLGDTFPFVLAVPAIVLVALRHGAAPGILTTLICGAWVGVSGLHPGVAAADVDADIAIRLGGFVVSAVTVCLICGQFRGSMPRPTTGIDERSRPTTDSGLIRWLRAVVWGAALLPLAAFGAACWWGYHKAFSEADEAVLRANTVVTRHAENTFAAAVDVTMRVQQLVAIPDADLRAKAAEVNQRLRDIAIGRPAVLAISAWDETGHLLVSSRASPENSGVSIADRDYFRQLRSADVPLLVTELLQGRLAGRLLFNAATRRKAADGGFGGVIVVALDPGYFQDFYRSLAVEKPGFNSFSLFRADGAFLTRWPATAEGTTRVPQRSPLLLPARAGEKSGVLFMRSSFDTERRLISFQRVGDLPLYVTAGLSEAVILARWHRFVLLLSAILLPTTAILVYVASVALQKTRREQAVESELQDELHRRIQAEHALLQSQKLEALGQLTGGVAHDFNNLLAVVNNSIHVHKQLHPELANSSQLAAIARAVASGGKLTRQLLSFARKQAFRAELISLQEWLPDVGQLLRTTLGGEISLSLDVDADTAPINVDAVELELALINLAVNAKDAIEGGGSVEIKACNALPDASSASPRVVIRVADSGTGIGPEALGKVFEPFFTTKAPGKGSGLGLSQVYGLCIQAGGAAGIDSKPGAGTVVSMFFPAAAKEPREPPLAPQTFRQVLSGRVLMVEDNEDLADAQALLLKVVGLTVVRAVNADAALSMLQSQADAYDVVLSDIVMPGSLDGIQLAFRVRETMPHMPVILITGYASRLQQATAAGFPVLTKPVEPLELFAALERAIRGVAPAPAAA